MPISTSTATSAWTPPPVIQGFSGTAQEPESHIMLNWDGSTLSDTDFNMYRLYRREQGAELWSVLLDIPNKATMMYEDNTAGQTILYEYMITQFQNITGDVPLESNPSDIVSAALTTDAWFIVMLVATDFHAIELNVTDEEHTSVMQQEVFEPLASDRKRVVRGNILGDEGSLTAMFDTMESRMAKNHMDHIKMNRGPHLLKSPFGDVWFVEFDAPGYKYTTGGHLQVNIGWVEIV